MVDKKSSIYSIWLIICITFHEHWKLALKERKKSKLLLIKDFKIVFVYLFIFSIRLTILYSIYVYND